MDALTTYRLFAANADKTLERVSNSPQIAREVEYYLENIGNVKSVDDLVDDPTLLKVSMTAYGLEDLSYAKAFVKKVLDEGPGGFSADLTDQRYAEYAKAFDFNAFGSATTSFSRAQEGVVDKYYQQAIEKQAGEDNVGARLAIYFNRKVDDISRSIDVLADPALTQVFQVALGLPQQMSLSTIERQQELIEDRIDFEDLKDPQFVEEFITKFVALWDIQNPSSGSTTPLIAAFGSTQNLSLDVIASVQNFKSRF